MRIGRIDPCWCGSHKKFKKCHGFSDEPFTFQETGEQLQKAFERRECLHPGDAQDQCRGRIVQAHTIQRGGGLSKIAEKGKVLTLRPGSALGFVAGGGQIRARPIGIKDASTFTGFCEKHDATVFGPLERVPFIGSAQQAFLLLYRAVSHELYLKRSLVKATAIVGDQARRTSSHGEREFFFLGQVGALLGTRDLGSVKSRLDRILLAGTHDAEIDYVVIELSGTPDVVCAGATAPQKDLRGNPLQDIEDHSAIVSTLGFALIPTDTGGAAVLSWLRGDEPPRNFAESLAEVSRDLLPSTLVNVAFEYFENTYMRPTWWRGLSEQSRRAFLRRAVHGTSLAPENRADLLVPVEPLALAWRATDVKLGISSTP